MKLVFCEWYISKLWLQKGSTNIYECSINLEAKQIYKVRTKVIVPITTQQASDSTFEDNANDKNDDETLVDYHCICDLIDNL